MVRIVFGIVAVIILWPLSALYRLIGALPLLVLCSIAAVALFAWTNRDA